MPQDLRKAPWLQLLRLLQDAAKDIIKSDEMRLAATRSDQLPSSSLRQEQLYLWQSSYICPACT